MKMMLSNTQRTMLQTKGVVIGRVLMGLLFFASGLGMLLTQTPTGVAGYFGSLGLPLPMVLAWLVIILKIVAGGLLIIGKRVGLAAGALAIFTLLTIFIAHFSLEDGQLFKNLAIIGGLMYAIAFGGGSWNAPKKSL